MKRIGISLLVGLLAAVPSVHAAIVDSGTVSIIDGVGGAGEDIFAFPAPQPSGSGQGTLDLLLFTFSAGGSLNTQGSFNGDDANTDFSNGGGPTADNINSESYITSFGDLQNFYKLEFPDGLGGTTVNEIVVFVDINETGGLQDIILNRFEMVTGYTIPSDATRQNPAANDITSAQQNSINTTWQSGNGTRIAKLASDAPYSLAQVATGTGRADYFILTGINPFAYPSTDRLLFYWHNNGSNSGGEDVFLSGKYRAENLCTISGRPCVPLPPPPGVIPEPSSLLLLGSGSLGLLGFGVSRRRA